MKETLLENLICGFGIVLFGVLFGYVTVGML